MSKAHTVACAFNSWLRGGRDLMGGADGEAIDELLSELLAEPGSEPHHSDGKNTPCYE